MFLPFYIVLILFVSNFSYAQKFPSVFQNSDLYLMYRFQNENVKRAVEINKEEDTMSPLVSIENENELDDEVSTIKIMPKPLSYFLLFKSLRSPATRIPRNERSEVGNFQPEKALPAMPNLQTFRYFMKQQPLFG